MKYEDFCNNLKKARKEAGITLKRMSELIGKADSIISRYESGEVQIPILTFFDFAEVTGKHPSWFFSPPLSGQSINDFINSDPSLKDEDRQILIDIYQRLHNK